MKNRDKIILGQNCIYGLDEAGNNNTLVIGATGSGKTRSIVEPTLLSTEESSLVLSDPKGRLFERYEEYFRKKGYKVELIDLIDPKKSTIGYDPVRFLTEHTYIYSGRSTCLREMMPRISDIDCVSLARLIMLTGTGQNHYDPFWDNMAIVVMSAAISFSTQHEGIDKRTMENVIRYLDSYAYGVSPSKMETIYKLLTQKEIESFGARQYSKVRQMPEKTMGSVYSTIGSILGRFSMSDIAQLMQREMILNPLTFLKEKTVLFVKVSDIDASLHAFANIMYTQIMQALFKIKDMIRYRDTRPVRFILDDYAASVIIPDMPRWISVMRERDISVMLILQSITQLVSAYQEADARTIMSNCDYIAYLSSNDLETVKEMAYRVDAPVQELLYDSGDAVYVLRSGHPPVRTTRYNIHRMWEYQKIKQKDVTHRTRKRSGTTKNPKKIAMGFHLSEPAEEMTI